MKKMNLCMTMLLILQVCGGCAAIVMSEYQEVELVNIPKHTKFETQGGEKFNLSPGRDVIDLKRSRLDRSVKIYCKGSKKPIRQTLRTYPNLAFVVGNIFMAFPIGHGIDFFFDGGWDYREPINIGDKCQ